MLGVHCHSCMPRRSRPQPPCCRVRLRHTRSGCGDAQHGTQRQRGCAARHAAAQRVPRPAPRLRLQALNAYADQLSQGLRPTPAKLTFYVRGGEGEALTEVRRRAARVPLPPIAIACLVPFGRWPLLALYQPALHASGAPLGHIMSHTADTTRPPRARRPADPSRAARLRLPGTAVLRIWAHHSGRAEGRVWILRPGCAPRLPRCCPPLGCCAVARAGSCPAARGVAA